LNGAMSWVRIIWQQSGAGSFGILHGLCAAHAEKHILAATRAAADQSRPLPPGRKQLRIACFVAHLLELEINACNLDVASRPRTSNRCAVINNMGHGAVLESLPAELRNPAFFFLRAYLGRLCRGAAHLLCSFAD